MSEIKVNNNSDLLSVTRDFIEVTSGSGCKLISESIVKTSILKVLCECNRYFETSFNGFKAGKRTCGYCSGRKDVRRRNRPMSWTTSEMKNFVEIHSNSGCRLLNSERNGVSSVVTLRCFCGNIFSLRFDFFRDRLKRRECEHCEETKKFNKVKSFVESCNCELLNDKYINTDEKLSFRCECGNIFEASYNAFKNSGQHRCKACVDNQSTGEKAIFNYLKALDVSFKSEYTISDCYNKRPLPFDFAIIDFENKPKLLIEYDGKQHFEPIEFFGGKSQLKNQQKNDRIKNQYCKDNNIPLLRIPYWEFDSIEKILEHSLKNVIK